MKIYLFIARYLSLEIKTESSIQTNSVGGIWHCFSERIFFLYLLPLEIVLWEYDGHRKKIMYNDTTNCIKASSGSCFRHPNTVSNTAVECPGR